MDANIDALKESAKAARGDDKNADTSSEVPERVQNAPRMHIRPEVVLYFDEILDVGFTGDVNDTQNLRGEPTNGYGGSIAVTFENPRIGDGNLYRSTDEDQATDYKFFGDATSKPWELNGETVGVKYDSNTFEGELIDEFDTDVVTVYFNGPLGEFIAKTLDCAGGFTVDGYTDPIGVMEYDPQNNYKGAVRARPILRPDMEGRAGALLVEADEDGPFQGTVFRFDDEGDFDPLSYIDAQDHPAYRNKADAVYIGELAFDHSGDGASDDAPDEDTTVEDELDTSAFDAVTDDSSSTAAPTTSYPMDGNSSWTQRSRTDCHPTRL